MARKLWTEMETKLALFLYFQLPYGKIDSRTKEIQDLALLVGRTPSSVAMKLANFASLDPKIIDSGRKGLAGASALDRSIFDRFKNDWTALVIESESLWADLEIGTAKTTLQEMRASFNFVPFDGPTTRQSVIEQRRGQDFFRRAVLANYDETCCITGIADARLLNASHIKPWNVDEANRHNPANGFALTATFDRAFDIGLITVDTDRCVRISKQLLDCSSEKTRRHFEPYDGKKIRPASRFNPDPLFLIWHNNERYVDAH